jgi:hypothetical protein
LTRPTTLPRTVRRTRALIVADGAMFAPGREVRPKLFARRVCHRPDSRVLEIDPVTATAVAIVSCFAGTAANDGRRPAWRVCVAAAVPRHGDLSSALEILALGRRRLFLGQPALKRTGTTAQRIEAALRPAPHLLERDLSVAATLGARLFTTAHRGLGAAAGQICFGKLGLPMLCSAVVGCTWLSGSFLSKAFWVLRYWDHRSSTPTSRRTPRRGGSRVYPGA